MSYNSVASKKSRGIVNSVSSNSSSAGDGDEYQCIDIAELMRKSAMKVTMATLYERPLAGLSALFQIAGAVHQAVLVTLEDGTRYLIHKVVDEKDSEKKRGKTIVANAEHMDKAWRSAKTKKISKSTLNNYVEKCGSFYDLVRDNCTHAATRMMELD